MRNVKNTFLATFLVLLALACKEKPSEDEKGVAEIADHPENFYGLEKEKFDTIIDGKEVKLYWIKNDNIAVAFTNYGGRIVGLWVPDKTGKMTDVVVGMNSVSGFANATEPYFGATIGRVGNRIAKGKFTLNGTEYSIPKNNNGNTLHGGNKGFQYVVWEAKQPDDKTLVFTYDSPDMEEGFPGNLKTTVTYTLNSDNSLDVLYEATTDKTTIVNLTQHSYFNLSGDFSQPIIDHVVEINADKFVPVNE